MNGFDNEGKTSTGTIESQEVEMVAMPVVSRSSCGSSDKKGAKIEPEASKVH